jgi:hypothetical protein
MLRLLSFILLISFSTAAFSQASVGDIALSKTLKVGSKTLVLNGAGMREKFFIDLYAVALYLEQKNDKPMPIMTSMDHMAMRIYIVSGLITSEKMKEATLIGFEKSMNGNIAPIKNKIDLFLSAFSGELNSGDMFELIHLGDNIIRVYKNGVHRISIEGADFKKAAIGIWLSDNPIDETLKNELLGIN